MSNEKTFEEIASGFTTEERIDGDIGKPMTATEIKKQSQNDIKDSEERHDEEPPTYVEEGGPVSKKTYDKLASDPPTDALSEENQFPHIVVLIGSLRFESEYREMARRRTLAGAAVLMPHVFNFEAGLTANSATYDQLTTLTKQQINLADEILVINPRGYVGEGTARLIEYADENEVPVTYLTPPTT